MKERNIKRHKFLIRKKHRNFRGLFGEKKKNTGKILNGLEVSRGTLNTKRNKKN